MSPLAHQRFACFLAGAIGACSSRPRGRSVKETLAIELVIIGKKELHHESY